MFFNTLIMEQDEPYMNVCFGTDFERDKKWKQLPDINVYK